MKKEYMATARLRYILELFGVNQHLEIKEGRVTILPLLEATEFVH